MAYIINRGTPYARVFIPASQLTRANMNYSPRPSSISYGTPGLSKSNTGPFSGSTINQLFSPINSVLRSVGNGIRTAIDTTSGLVPSWSPFKINSSSTYNPYSQEIAQRFFASANASRPAFGPWVASDMTGGAGAFRTAQAKGEQMITNQMLARQQQQQNPQVIYRNAPGTTLSTLGGINNSAWRSQNISGQSKNKRYANGMNAFVINSDANSGLNRMR